MEKDFLEKHKKGLLHYRLHMVCVLEDFNQMQERYFVAVDIQNRNFYRVCETIGNWGESRYILDLIDIKTAENLFYSITDNKSPNNTLFFNDWEKLTSCLQNTEIVEILNSQILIPQKKLLTEADMFLFKNTKSLVKRIGMNMAVYGYFGANVVIVLTLALPASLEDYLFYGVVAFAVVSVIGALLSFVFFVKEKIWQSRINRIRLFNKNMKPYIDAQMVRVIISRKHFVVISLGDRIYAVCPYALCEKEYTVGLYLKTSGIKHLAKNEKEIYSIINTMFDNVEKYKNFLFVFSEDQIEAWKQWTEEHEHINEMDPEFEKALINKNR